MGKLFQNKQIPEIESQGSMETIVDGLFPELPKRPQTTWKIESITTDITKEELLKATTALPNNKTPGPDGVPIEMIKKLAKLKPEMLFDVFNKCLNQGCFPHAGKWPYWYFSGKRTGL